MSFRFIPPALRALVLGLALAGLTGCSTFHGWAQASSAHPATAGASISVPLGK